MIGKFPGSFLLVLLISFLTLAGLGVQSADAYRICTFKGKVVGHGWRTMIVNSNGQCATVNVGWRTKYIPSRRPCLGERVAVDFTLEDGFMKAIKVVSLSPPPAASSCYPPAPPRTTACREAVDNAQSANVLNRKGPVLERRRRMFGRPSDLGRRQPICARGPDQGRHQDQLLKTKIRRRRRPLNRLPPTRSRRT